MLRGETAVIGIGETPYSRGRVDRGEQLLTAEEYYAWAVELALRDAGLSKEDLDNQGFGVIGSEWPHSEIWSAEVVQNLGISPKLLFRADHGGANAAALLIQATSAIRAGLVDLVLLAGADSPTIVKNGPSRTWRYELDFLRPLGAMGPVTMAALMMQRYMHQHGAKLEHFGKVAVTQRKHAQLNPNAYMKTPLTMEDYLNSRQLSDPLRLLDSVMFVNGGLAFIVASRKYAERMSKKAAYLLGTGAAHYYTRGPKAQPDLTVTGIVEASKQTFQMANLSPKDMSFFQAYDDFTVAVLMQIGDAGFAGDSVPKFLDEHDISIKGDLPVNTGGGLLSGGQPGMAAGFVHVVEAVRQLRGEGGDRQVKGAKFGLATALGALAFGGNFTNSYAMIFGSEV